MLHGLLLAMVISEGRRSKERQIRRMAVDQCLLATSRPRWTVDRGPCLYDFGEGMMARLGTLQQAWHRHDNLQGCHPLAELDGKACIGYDALSRVQKCATAARAKDSDMSGRAADTGQGFPGWARLGRRQVRVYRAWFRLFVQGVVQVPGSTI
ncbi:hypothetical protein GGTG_01149 [Gaeumannomyces tritici R3-111a-1]|uniref:Uncharacterized protein n=1 Tax=Gaeumannomyces tritici (strain R3-111a-1) TaxID=644352 RepID=J3NIR5_GAET3|nr:hypothetical protein GGTG_01149 [Gaeumannomyces tritici R3-111a-1]EJT81165.1 hypothetical protein GGTG_01149 [Gaeumannomyces tritici R3-111a-1]